MAFEAFLLQDKRRPKKGRRLTYTLSLALHGALLFVGVIYSFWHVDELSPPNVAVTFMSATAPPPPPPPPPKKKSVTKTKVVPREIVQPKPNQIIQPKEQPKEEEEPDDGVEGGVEGGVAGGVIGGMGTAPPPAAPKFLPPNVAKMSLLINPQDDAYRAKVPPALARAGMVLWAMLKVCVKTDGHVDEVKILKGADPTLDPNIIAAIRTWRFKPYSVDGRPVPFCTNYRYEISTASH
jgi:periplasmic protein TonB